MEWIQISRNEKLTEKYLSHCKNTFISIITFFYVRLITKKNIKTMMTFLPSDLELVKLKMFFFYDFQVMSFSQEKLKLISNMCNIMSYLSDRCIYFDESFVYKKQISTNDLVNENNIWILTRDQFYLNSTKIVRFSFRKKKKKKRNWVVKWLVVMIITYLSGEILLQSCKYTRFISQTSLNEITKVEFEYMYKVTISDN